jgi:hypothetical protein
MKGVFRKEIREYLNYVLTKVDHSDKEAMSMAYKLQKISMKENFIMRDLLEIVRSEEAQEKEEKGSRCLKSMKRLWEKGI